MNSTEYTCFLNGELADLVSAKDRGFCYGHGLFETIRLTNANAPLWRYHVSRLKSGAARLGIPIDEQLLDQYCDQLLEACPANGVMKIIVTAGSGGRGYRVDASSSPNYLLQWFPLPAYPLEHWQQGVALKLCQHRLPSSPNLAGIKHLNRLDQVLARSEWGDDYPEGLMLDQQGNAVEGVSSNLFYYHAGKWWTPSLDQCGVAGVMRQYLLDELLPGLSLPVQEKTISSEELLSVDELFVCNSVMGVWPVVSLENCTNWIVGERTKQIQTELQRVLSCFG
ncbi:MAG: aminodeoxychorismate lyase [Porticoccus sp.]|nr:aminodeoxychorismate lyase [Porticoccus sp.]